MSRRQRDAIEQIEWMRNLLAFVLVGAFVVFSGALLWKGIPEKNEQLISYMLGQLSGMALTALGFYFVNKVGQDALDAKRAENTGKLADAVTTAVQSSTTPDVKEAEARGAETVADAAEEAKDTIVGAKP